MHKYKQLVGIILFVVTACFLITGLLGDTLYQSAVSQHPVQVDDRKFTPGEFQRAQNQLSRQAYGSRVPAQRVADYLIDTYLIERTAEQFGFRVGNDQLKEVIGREFFKNGKDGYVAALQQQGMSAPEFERSLRDELLRQMYIGLIADTAFATKREALAMAKKRATTYSVSGVLFKPESYRSAVPAPTEEQLLKKYEETAVEYEIPARVAYEYLVFDPKSFREAVPVTQQDIELHYAENESQFTTKEQARVRAVKFLYPKESDPAAMAAVREKATKVREEALAGKPFAELVTMYSDDFAAKATGGDLGWQSRETLEKPVAEAVFALTSPGIAELVELDYGFQVVKVEELKPAAKRPLKDVEAEIRTTLQDRDSPSFAAAEAYRIAELAKKAGSLEAVASEAKLTLQKSSGLLEEDKDPAPELASLSRQLLETPEGERGVAKVVSIGDLSVVARVTDYRGVETLPFDAVKSRVQEALITQKSSELASAAADSFLKELSTDKPDVKTVAAKHSFTVEGPTTLGLGKVGEGVFANPAITQAAIKQRAAPKALPEVFRVPNGFVVAAVDAITTPDLKDNDKEVVQSMMFASRMMGQQLIESNLEALKSRASIDIDSRLLGE
jgi:peptidyl-prolyl cis-trans isomerase D